MHRVYDTDNKDMSLYITIKCKEPKEFRVWCEDLGKLNSKYADRVIKVEGDRTIYFSLPVCPKRLYIGVVNTQNLHDSDFTVEIQEGKLKTYNIWMDDDTREFLKLATYFSQVSGFTPALPNGRLFHTEDKKFNIKYYPVIMDVASGKPMNTPARIGHQSGIIDTAKAKFDQYTIPMRMIILLHEFSHKYKNPKINLEISDEVGADINAIYLYLGLGYSKIDAICVYTKIFLVAQSQGNMNRIRKIMTYIQKFENEEYAQSNLK